MAKKTTSKEKNFDFAAFGEAIAIARVKQELTYMKAGELVGTAGPNLERIEKVTQEPKVSLALAICERLLKKPLSSFIK